MIYRYYQKRIEDDRLITVKRKYEWWELKLIHMVADNNLESTLSAVHAHLTNRAQGYTSPSLHRGILDALASETRLAASELVNLIDAFEGASGDDLGSVQDLVQRYVAILPPV